GPARRVRDAEAGAVDPPPPLDERARRAGRGRDRRSVRLSRGHPEARSSVDVQNGSRVDPPSHLAAAAPGPALRARRSDLPAPDLPGAAQRTARRGAPPGSFSDPAPDRHLLVKRPAARRFPAWAQGPWLEPCLAFVGLLLCSGLPEALWSSAFRPL